MAEDRAGWMSSSLYEGERVVLAAPDPARDADILSRWSHDPDSWHLVSSDPLRPLAPGPVRKKLEQEIKDNPDASYFALRLRADDRLLGLACLEWIEWSHGSAWLSLQIGDPQDRGHGYGSEALGLLLRYAFEEMNLYRLTARVAEYNLVGLEFLRQAGFQEEVRQRQALHRAGRRWDLLLLGLLRADWTRTAGAAGGAE